MNGFLTLFAFIASTILILRLLEIRKVFEWFMFCFCIMVTQITISGYVLSSINHIGDILYWLIIGILLLLILTILYFVLKKPSFNYSFQSCCDQFFKKYISTKIWLISEYQSINKRLIPLLFSLILLIIVNFYEVLFTSPHNWDSMAVHLARMAYYIQHNNLNYFISNHWAQVTHPKIQSILLIFSYLSSGRNENLTQIIQFFAYLVSIICVYSITINCGKTKSQGLFSAAISGLLIEWLMESTTTQSDMLVTSFIGIAVYSLISYRKTQKVYYLAFVAIPIMLALGSKEAAIIPIISLGILCLYCLINWSNGKAQNKLLFFFCFLFIAGIVILLPSGYLEVNKIFGNSTISGFSFVGEKPYFIFINGIKNVLRFGFDSFSFDGIPAINIIKTIQTTIRTPFQYFVNNILDIKLETSIASAIPFRYSRLPIAHEDRSWWGVFGFGFCWIGVIVAIFNKKSSMEEKILAFSVILFVFLQAFYGPYDPFRGRYFCSCAIFALPLITIFFDAKKPLVRLYSYIVVLIGIISAISGVLLRADFPIFTVNFKGFSTYSIFSEDRISQLTASSPQMEIPLRNFNNSVPEDAIVAIYLKPDSYEYPLFGKSLNRTILPINSIVDGIQPLPEEATYLLYTDDGYPCKLEDDIFIGTDYYGDAWYIRKLTDQNCDCHW